MKTSMAATLVLIFISIVYVNPRSSKSDQMTAVTDVNMV